MYGLISKINTVAGQRDALASILVEATHAMPGCLSYADLALVVRVSRDGFIASTECWVRRHDWFAFAQALTILEARLQGEATVEGMSPEELSLRFSVFSFDSGEIVPFAQEARRISEALGARRGSRS